MGITFWGNGKPIATTDEKMAKRLEVSTKVIDKILKDMGYSEGYGKYSEYVNKMVQEDFKGKYMPFLEKVDRLMKEYDATGKIESIKI
jgi:hypothetical protein